MPLIRSVWASAGASVRRHAGYQYSNDEALAVGGGHRELDAEFVSFVRLAFARTFDLGDVR
jgi:hypothetical protein